MEAAKTKWVQSSQCSLYYSPPRLSGQDASPSWDTAARSGTGSGGCEHTVAEMEAKLVIMETDT